MPLPFLAQVISKNVPEGWSFWNFFTSLELIHMSIDAVITGNLLENPTQRTVTLTGGERRITALRVMSDVWRSGGEGQDPVQDPTKTRPVALTIWNERLGDAVMATLRAGMRVEAKGDLYLHEWHPNDAQRAEGKNDLYELRCDVNDIGLKLNRIEGVQMRTRQADPSV